MNRLQWVSLGVALVLVALIFKGFATAPSQTLQKDRSRAMQGEANSPEFLLMKARQQLTQPQQDALALLNTELEQSKDTLQKVAVLKRISGQWYTLKQPAIAAWFAEQVATLDPSDSTWSIAGANYYIGIREEKEESVRQMCKTRAVKAFEKAISLAPDVVDHRINLALTYVELPSPDQPMQGILLLRELNKQYPQNVAVMLQLAALAVKTQQWDRAKERLNQALAIAPDNIKAICMMAMVSEQSGDSANAEKFNKRCLENSPQGEE